LVGVGFFVRNAVGNRKNVQRKKAAVCRKTARADAVIQGRTLKRKTDVSKDAVPRHVLKTDP